MKTDLRKTEKADEISQEKSFGNKNQESHIMATLWTHACLETTNIT